MIHVRVSNKKSGLIYIRGKYKGKELYISLSINLFEGAKIEDNNVVYRGKNSEKIAARNTLNKRIQAALTAVSQSYNELNDQNRLTVPNLKAAIISKLEHKKQNKEIADLAAEYKKGLYNGTIFSDKGTTYTYNSIRALASSVLKFGDYCSEHGLSLFDLDERTGVKFLQWAGREIEVENKDGEIEIQQATLATLAKDIKNAKTFCRWLIDAGHLTVKDRFFEAWKRPRDIETPKIYLSEAELKKLDGEFIDAKIAKYKLLFLIMARTGLRVSDLVKLKPAALKSGKDGFYLDFLQEKTETRVTIPVNDLTKEYLDTFFSDPHFYDFTPQKLNKHIKTIGAKADIKDPIVCYTKTLKGVEETTVEKWTLLTCHVARHSFACNLYLKNAPLSLISRLLGHSDERVTLRYIKSALPDIVEQTNNIRDYF